jgi:hypothetical protein
LNLFEDQEKIDKEKADKKIQNLYGKFRSILLKFTDETIENINDF